MCLLPAVSHPQAAVVSRPAPSGGTVLLDESLINGGPNDLVGGDGRFVELKKARH